MGNAYRGMLGLKVEYSNRVEWNISTGHSGGKTPTVAYISDSQDVVPDQWPQAPPGNDFEVQISWYNLRFNESEILGYVTYALACTQGILIYTKVWEPIDLVIW